VYIISSPQLKIMIGGIDFGMRETGATVHSYIARGVAELS
jgi:hypothetical protein